jgi:hypothetical protein
MPTSKARGRDAIVGSQFPTPSTDPIDREWANAFIRALTAEFDKVIQPIGTQFIVSGFATSRTFTGPSARTARCQVGTVTVVANGGAPESVVITPYGLGGEIEERAADPRGTPTNTGDVLATLLKDLQTRGWLA